MVAPPTLPAPTSPPPSGSSAAFGKESKGLLGYLGGSRVWMGVLLPWWAAAQVVRVLGFLGAYLYDAASCGGRTVSASCLTGVSCGSDATSYASSAAVCNGSDPCVSSHSPPHALDSALAPAPALHVHRLAQAPGVDAHWGSSLGNEP